MSDERTRILQVMARVLETEASELPANPTQSEDGAWDSLTHFELIMAIEAEFGRRFETKRIPQLTSLSSIEKELANVV